MDLKKQEELDNLHLAKIDLSQAIVVIDVDGHTGKSTKAKIAHARQRNKPIYYWSDKSWKKLLD